MVEHALGMLRQQGWGGTRSRVPLSRAARPEKLESGRDFRGVGDRSRVLIVGDRFDTDVRAGSLAGVRTCLVESGCHQHALQPHFADAPAEFVAASVASLIPPHRRHDPSERPRTVAFDLCQPRVAIMARPGSISPVLLLVTPIITGDWRLCRALLLLLDCAEQYYYYW